MRARKDSGGVSGSQHRDAEDAGVEKRFIADASFRAGRVCSVVFLPIEIVRIERSFRNAPFEPSLTAEARQQRLGRGEIVLAHGSIRVAEEAVHLRLEHHSIARYDASYSPRGDKDLRM